MRMARLALLLWGTLGLAACGQQTSQQQQEKTAHASPTSVHSVMTKRVDPLADAIWDIGNTAMNDEAGIDPAKMSPKAWRDMEAAAAQMEDAARALGKLQPIRVVNDGERIVDEGNPRAPTGARVQTHIDTNPDMFRSMSASLEEHGRDLAVAARARDAQTAGRLVNEIDGVCEGCHLQFWYPEDRKVLDALAGK